MQAWASCSVLGKIIFFERERLISKVTDEILPVRHDRNGIRRIQTWWSRPKNAQTEWFEGQNQHYSESFDQDSSALSIRNANRHMSCVHLLHRLYPEHFDHAYVHTICPLQQLILAFVRTKLGVFLSQYNLQIFSKCIWGDEARA